VLELLAHSMEPFEPHTLPSSGPSVTDVQDRKVDQFRSMTDNLNQLPITTLKHRIEYIALSATGVYIEMLVLQLTVSDSL
jgi:hypothetical protein